MTDVDKGNRTVRTSAKSSQKIFCTLVHWLASGTDADAARHLSITCLLILLSTAQPAAANSFTYISC